MQFYLMRRASNQPGLGDALTIKVIPSKAAKGYTIPRGFPLVPLEKKEDALVLLAVILGQGRLCLRQIDEGIEVVQAQLASDMHTEFVPDARFGNLDPIKTVTGLIAGIMTNNPAVPFILTGCVFEVPDAQLTRYNLALRKAM